MLWNNVYLATFLKENINILNNFTFKTFFILWHYHHIMLMINNSFVLLPFDDDTFYHISVVCITFKHLQPINCGSFYTSFELLLLNDKILIYSEAVTV